MLSYMHRAKVFRANLARPSQPPYWSWGFVCHEVKLNGRGSYVLVCGEGSYRTWERAWKVLRMHALGRHDFVL